MLKLANDLSFQFQINNSTIKKKVVELCKYSHLNIIYVVKDITELTIFCKKYGFAYQSGNLYGGLGGVYDYGPHGIFC